MPDLEYTVTRIDVETLEKLREMAAANLRSVPMQLRAMIIGTEQEPAVTVADEVNAALISALQNSQA